MFRFVVSIINFNDLFKKTLRFFRCKSFTFMRYSNLIKFSEGMAKGRPFPAGPDAAFDSGFAGRSSRHPTFQPAIIVPASPRPARRSRLESTLPARSFSPCQATDAGPSLSDRRPEDWLLGSTTLYRPLPFLYLCVAHFSYSCTSPFTAKHLDSPTLWHHKTTAKR